MTLRGLLFLLLLFTSRQRTRKKKKLGCWANPKRRCPLVVCHTSIEPWDSGSLWMTNNTLVTTQTFPEGQ